MWVLSNRSRKRQLYYFSFQFLKAIHNISPGIVTYVASRQCVCVSVSVCVCVCVCVCVRVLD